MTNISSVSVVIQHQNEIIMCKRRYDLKAFPGYDAFVGGKIEKTDPDSKFAAFREVNEELGIDLNQPGLVENMRSLGEFTTPQGFTRRFCNETFLVQLSTRPTIKVDKKELIDARWINIDEVNKLFQAGDLLVVPAVKVIFQALHTGDDPKQAMDKLALQRQNDFYPIDFVDELNMLCVPSNTILPAEHTNCFLIDDLIIDPSPKDEETFNKLSSYFSDKSFKRILLTHHHPDHRQFSNELARRLAASILMSEFTYSEIIKEEGQEFFENVRIQIINDLDIICHWKQEPVRCLHIPGHDEGQMAIMPDSKKWMIVGDLIQGIGTVVIAEPEGDMQKYFSSLDRCLELDPKVIIPSHGEALGSTYYLGVTLEHRKLREGQVAKAKLEGKSLEDMLDIIYPKLDERLKPLALENIKSHLRKLNLTEDC